MSATIALRRKIALRYIALRGARACACLLLACVKLLKRLALLTCMGLDNELFADAIHYGKV